MFTSEPSFGARFRAKVISVHGLDRRLVALLAAGVGMILLSGLLLALRDLPWQRVSAGVGFDGQPATVPLPVLILATGGVILAWTYLLDGALQGAPALAVTGLLVYTLVGLIGVAETLTDGDPLSLLGIPAGAVLLVPWVHTLLDWWLAGRHHQNRTPRTFLGGGFLWVLGSTTAFYLLLLAGGFESGTFGNVLTLQFGVVQYLLIPLLILSGADLAEWADLAGERVSAVLARIPTRGLVLASIVVGLLLLLFVAWVDRRDVATGLVGIGLAALVAIPVGVLVVRTARRGAPGPPPLGAIALAALVTFVGEAVGGLVAVYLLGLDEGQATALTAALPLIGAVISSAIGLWLLRRRASGAGLFLTCFGIIELCVVLSDAVSLAAHRSWLAGFGVESQVAVAALLLLATALNSLRAGRWGLAALPSILCLGVGFVGLTVLYLLFDTALEAGHSFSVLQASVLLLAVLWDLLVSGAALTNVDGRLVPRPSRLLLYLGFSVLVTTVVLFDSSVSAQDGTAAGIGFEHEEWPKLGIIELGVPLLICLFTVRLASLGRARGRARRLR